MTEEQIREKACIAFTKWLPKIHPEVIENEDEYEEYSNGLIEGWYGGYEQATKELQEENERLKSKEYFVGDKNRQNMELQTKVEVLEAQIEKMKCCYNCKHSRTVYEHCRTDKHEKWEIKEK